MKKSNHVMELPSANRENHP